MPPNERSSLDTLTGGDQDGASFSGLAAEIILGKLDQIAADARKPVHPRIPWPACHPIWQTGQVPLTAGAGTLQAGNLYGPETPYWWDVRAISVWGFTAGSVSVFLNNVNGEILGVATTPGQFTWSAQELLGPQDNVIWTATGITGVVNVNLRAIEVASEWLPEYLV